MLNEQNNHTEGLPVQRDVRELFTVAEFAQLNEFAYLSESALRHLIFKASPRISSSGTEPGNGLTEAGAIIKLGRKILIDAAAFRRWVSGQKP